jgi:hypothetical protein
MDLYLYYLVNSDGFQSKVSWQMENLYLYYLVNSDGFQSKVSWQMENSCGKLHETITIGNYG